MKNIINYLAISSLLVLTLATNVKAAEQSPKIEQWTMCRNHLEWVYTKVTIGGMVNTFFNQVLTTGENGMEPKLCLTKAEKEKLKRPHYKRGDMMASKDIIAL